LKNARCQSEIENPSHRIRGSGGNTKNDFNLPAACPSIFAPVQSLGSELLATEFFDRLGRIGWNMTVFNHPKKRRIVIRARLMVATA